VQDIYTYIHDTNSLPKEYNVASIQILLFMVHISLVSVLNLLYFYISNFRSNCAVPHMTFFCSTLTSCFPGMFFTYFLEEFEIFPVAPIITCITYVIIIIIIIIIINIRIIITYGYLLSQEFSSWYFSWTSGDPQPSGFNLHTAVLSVLCVMFQVYLSFVVNLSNIFMAQLPNFSLSFSLLFQWLQVLLV